MTCRPGPPTVTGMARIPLFPLGHPLVPGAALQLRIFEPRYLELLDDLRAAPPEDRLFGVVLIARGHEVGERPNWVRVRRPGQVAYPNNGNSLRQIGCVARLEQVAPQADESRVVFAIRAMGTRRFRIDRLADSARRYAVADVDWLDDGRSDSPTDIVSLAEEAEALRLEHAAYGRRLGVALPPLEAPDEEVAWRAAEHTVLTPMDVQSILEITDALRRTRAMRDHLRREGQLATRFSTIPHVAGPEGAGLN